MEGEESHGLACLLRHILPPHRRCCPLSVTWCVAFWLAIYESSFWLGARSIPLIHFRAFIEKSWVPRCHTVLYSLMIVISAERSTCAVFVLQRRLLGAVSLSTTFRSVALGLSAAVPRSETRRPMWSRNRRGRMWSLRGGEGGGEGKEGGLRVCLGWGNSIGGLGY